MRKRSQIDSGVKSWLCPAASLIAFLSSGFIAFADPSQGIEVRVRSSDGGPRIEVNGTAVPPTMFYGYELGSTARPLATNDWTRHTVTFLPDSDVARGTIHLNFDHAVSNSLTEIRNVRLVRDGLETGFGFEGSFEDETSFAKIWRVWSKENASSYALADGVLSVTTVPLASGADFHFYSADCAFSGGVAYRFEFEARSLRDASWVKVAMYDSATGRRVPWRDILYDQVALAAEAGTDFITWEVKSGWKREGFDFAGMNRQADSIIAANPHALLLPRIPVDAPDWWLEDHPEARMVFADGSVAARSSVSSRAYRSAATNYLAACCRNFLARYPENFAGVHPTGQNSHEWFYYDSRSRLAGYDPSTLAAWREAEGDPTATIPTAAERTAHATSIPFLDAETSAAAIRFNRFYQRELTDFLALLAATARRETAGKKLVVFFYGYTWEFLGDANGPAATGHFDVTGLLDRAGNDIDILAAPFAYNDRKENGAGPAMCAVETMMRRGVLYLGEDDTRTCFNFNGQDPNIYGPRTGLAGTLDLLRRNSAQMLLRGTATWWMDLSGAGWFASRKLWELRRELAPLERLALSRRRPYTPSIALIADERSLLQLSGDCSFVAYAALEARNALARTGFPYGQYLLEDVVAHPLDSTVTKMEVHTSPWSLSDAALAALAARRQTHPALRVWYYAPGWRDADGGTNLVRMTELTGFEFIPREPDANGDGAFTVLRRSGDQTWDTYSDGSPSFLIRTNEWGGADVFIGRRKGMADAVAMHRLAELAGLESAFPESSIGKVAAYFADGLGEDGLTNVTVLQSLTGESYAIQSGRAYDLLTRERVDESGMTTVTPSRVGESIVLVNSLPPPPDPVVEEPLLATIEIVDGAPVIGWRPKLTPEQESIRRYRLYGSQRLDPASWHTPVDYENDRFFYVSVELLDD